MLDFLAQNPILASHPASWTIASFLPRLLTGASLHRLALHALHGGDHAAALALFERGGLAYRHEVIIEALARLRVHEMMARVRTDERGDGAGARGASDSREALVLETERRLARLDRIEALEPPFALVDARELLASWYSVDGDTAAHAA